MYFFVKKRFFLSHLSTLCGLVQLLFTPIYTKNQVLFPPIFT